MPAERVSNSSKEQTHFANDQIIFSESYTAGGFINEYINEYIKIISCMGDFIFYLDKNFHILIDS